MTTKWVFKFSYFRKKTYLCRNFFFLKGNMKTIELNGRKFQVSIPESEILRGIDRVAEQIKQDFKDKNPLFIAVLNGSFMFASDLMKAVDIKSEITFVRLSSYSGMESGGSVAQMFGLDMDITGRSIVIIEDIVDSGLTMDVMIKLLNEKQAGDIHIATLLFKPYALKHQVPITYPVFEIPNDFVIGYGLDYDGYARNLRDIYTLVE